MDFVKTFDPRLLLGDRLDLTLYRMFTEAHLSGAGGPAETMYRRFTRRLAADPALKVDQFVELIESVRSHGCDPRAPVLANPREFTLREGADLCAIAMHLGITEVPFSLRFRDTRLADTKFRRALGREKFQLLQRKREEYIEACEPAIAMKCRLRMHMHDHMNSFQKAYAIPSMIRTLRFYQGFERLNIPGVRPVERRLALYELPGHLNRSMRALDIGCNVGFFALALSEHVKSVEALDPNPDYIEVAERVKAFLRVSNCRFLVAHVEDYRPEEPVDFLASAAIHRYLRLPFYTYVRTLSGWVRPGGLILFESHDLVEETDWPEKKAWLLAHFDWLAGGVVDDVDDRMYESELREFLLLRNRGTVEDVAGRASGSSCDGGREAGGPARTAIVGSARPGSGRP